MTFFFCLFRATLAAYGGSQARGQIRAASANYTTAPSNAGSLILWVRTGIEPAFSWVQFRFVSTEPRWALLHFFLKQSPTVIVGAVGQDGCTIIFYKLLAMFDLILYICALNKMTRLGRETFIHVPLISSEKHKKKKKRNYKKRRKNN